jgi:hypothetical protein
MYVAFRREGSALERCGKKRVWVVSVHCEGLLLLRCLAVTVKNSWPRNISSRNNRYLRRYPTDPEIKNGSFTLFRQSCKETQDGRTIPDLDISDVADRPIRFVCVPPKKSIEIWGPTDWVDTNLGTVIGCEELSQMKSRIMLPALAAGLILAAASNASAFELLDRVFHGNGGGCCAAAEPSCGCAPAATSCCGRRHRILRGSNCCEATCGAEVSCGVDVACGTSCKPKRNLLKGLFSCKKKSSCCDAAPSCGCEPAAPSCGCEPAAPSCGCESACNSCKPKRNLLKDLFKCKKKSSCCDAAPSCGCEPAPSCGCGH